ncbi:MAG: helix-turn-helix domain-containing protein [Anaerorhabdus sp.]|uniref:helix-turn-helix domain-containing protein n=1 Tax=Anaerorhabdus sp. TaxID=1872524 RepID=UPI002FCC2656
MTFKHKFSFELKYKVVVGWLNGEYTLRAACDKYDLNYGCLRNWIRLYNIFGEQGLKTGNKSSHYSSETKFNAVQDYLNNNLTVFEILSKYKMRSATQLRKWVIKYNSHIELKSSKSGGNVYMTKGRKTTYGERIEIIEFCIENNHDYTMTSEKYDVSYQQVYSWIKKYEKNGAEGLIDNRGRTKPKAELSEIEKLRLENRLLKAENKRKELELDFLKKLDEIERRRF